MIGRCPFAQVILKSLASEMGPPFDFLVAFFGAKEEWRSFYGEHIKLEQCDESNDFTLIETFMKEEKEKRLDFHVKTPTGR